MTDHFLTFSLPRRPWFEAEALRQSYLALSAPAHPDRVHEDSPEARRRAQDQSTAINAAYQCLRDPKERLRHLLELERGRPPEEIQSIPPAMAQAMMEVGRLGNEADAIIRRRQAETSVLLKAVSIEEARAAHERICAMLDTLNQWQAHLEAELREADGVWQNADAAARETLLAALEDLFRQFSYARKWRGQLEEKSFQLLL